MTAINVYYYSGHKDVVYLRKAFLNLFLPAITLVR